MPGSGPLSICALLLRTTLATAQCSSDDERLTLLQFRICVQNCSDCVVEDFTLQLCLERLFVNECDGCICPPSQRSATFSVYASPPFAERPVFDGDDCDEPSLPEVEAADLASRFFDGVTCKNLLSRPIALLPGCTCFMVVMRDCALFRKTFLKIYDARVVADGALSCPTRPPQRLKCKAKCKVCSHKVSKYCLIQGEQLPQEQTTELGAVVPFPTTRPFNVLFVTETGGGTAASFPNALLLTEALDQALDGDEIWVQAGTYDVGTTISISKQVRLYGGFQTLTDVARCQRDANPQTNNTILHGTDGLQTVLVLTGATRQGTLLDGFTIRHTPGELGSGIELQTDSGVTLRNVEIVDNISDTGAGLRALSNRPDVQLCQVAFRRNTATAIFGSAINLGGSTDEPKRLYGTNVIFDSNVSSAGNGSSTIIFGGNTTATLVNAVFIANTVSGPLDGVVRITANRNNLSTTLLNATFTENVATNSAAISVTHTNGTASLRVQNAIVWNDTAAVPQEIFADEATPGSVTFTIDHSLIDGYPGSVGGNVAPSIVGPPVKTSDPMFVAPPSNVRLQDGSPAIDCGDPALIPSAVALDLDRLPRVRDGTVDLGAYESHCSSTTTP